MGHYRSEMMTPDEAKAEAAWYKELRSHQDRGWWTAPVYDPWVCPVCASIVDKAGVEKHEKMHTKKQLIKAARAHQKKKEKYQKEQAAYRERAAKTSRP